MVSRTALLFVALAGVTLCVTATANADAGLESSAAFGSDVLETVEGTSGRSLLAKNKGGKPAPKYKPEKYLVFQNAQNNAVIIDIDTQVVIGNGNVVTNYGSNTINQNAQNSNSGRKLLTAPTKPKDYKKYIVFQNAQNKAVIYDQDTQAVVGDGNFVSNYGKNTINQNAQNFNGP